MINDSYEKETKEILKYLNKTIPQIFAKETKLQKNFSYLQNLKQEAIRLLQEMKKRPRTENSKLLKYQAALKSYVFIEKVREFFTKEEIQYLIMFGDINKDVDMKTLNLADIIPLFRPGYRGGNWNKIDMTQLKTHLNNVKSTFVLSQKFKNEILIFYQLLESAANVQKGYAYEAAVKASEFFNSEEGISQITKYQNWFFLKQKLLEIYKDQVGQTPFYVKGDIATDTFFKAFGLESQGKAILFQLKNLASSGRAQVATYATLTKLLIYFIYILESTNTEKEVEETFKEFFKTDKKISALITENVKTVVNNALQDFEKSMRIK